MFVLGAFSFGESAEKALYVRDNENRLPPKTHNLVKLAEKTTMSLTMEQKIFFDEVNDFNIVEVGWAPPTNAMVKISPGLDEQPGTLDLM